VSYVSEEYKKPGIETRPIDNRRHNANATGHSPIMLFSLT
jgi:hypothetical protein